MDLNAFIDHVVQHLGGVHLYHRTLRGKLFNRLQLPVGFVFGFVRRAAHLIFNQTDHPPRHRFRGKDADRHFRQLVLNRPKLGNRRAECLSLLGILQTNRQNILGRSNAG